MRKMVYCPHAARFVTASIAIPENEDVPVDEAEPAANPVAQDSLTLLGRASRRDLRDSGKESRA